MPAELSEWGPADDLSHFVIEAIERAPLGAFKVNWKGYGQVPVPSLALLIYRYANGIFSSRRIERATHRDVGARFVAADSHPDHDTIASFRRENAAATAAAFAEVVMLAREVGLRTLSMVSIGGSKIDANASKIRSVRYDRAQASRAQLDQDIAALMARAEAADAGDAPNPQALPKEIAQRLYDFRPPDPNPKPPPEPKAEWRQRMRVKLQTDDARSRYQHRKSTVELVFGIIKNVLGFTRFVLRGIENVKSEWLLAYNCKRLRNLMAA